MKVEEGEGRCNGSTACSSAWKGSEVRQKSQVEGRTKLSYDIMASGISPSSLVHGNISTLTDICVDLLGAHPKTSPGARKHFP
jgi:hypothetical protein